MTYYLVHGTDLLMSAVESEANLRLLAESQSLEHDYIIRGSRAGGKTERKLPESPATAAHAQLGHTAVLGLMKKEKRSRSRCAYRINIIQEIGGGGKAWSRARAGTEICPLFPCPPLPSLEHFHFPCRHSYSGVYKCMPRHMYTLNTYRKIYISIFANIALYNDHIPYFRYICFTHQ